MFGELFNVLGLGLNQRITFAMSLYMDTENKIIKKMEEDRPLLAEATKYMVSQAYDCHSLKDLEEMTPSIMLERLVKYYGKPTKEFINDYAKETETATTNGDAIKLIMKYNLGKALESTDTLDYVEKHF